MRRLLPALLLASLAACTLSLPGTAPKNPPANTQSANILPDAVQVTTLAPLPPTPTATPTGTPTGTPTAAQPAPVVAPTAAPTAPPPTLRPQPRPTTQAQPQPDSPRPSPQQIACQAKGGIWSANGASPLRTCLLPTRDAGKSCNKESDCDGLCLARSRTCAPVKPLFGCNDILQQDGSTATLCID